MGDALLVETRPNIEGGEDDESEWVRAEVMDLVQLATGLTVLTAGLMVLGLLVAGLCACTSSRRKTVKHCETSF